MHYHSQHSPFGAFASFTIGLPGARGGFGQSLPGPADQNVYAGYRQIAETSTHAPWTLLPFYKKQESSAAAAFVGEDAAHARTDTGPRMLDAARVVRHLGWASDTWEHEGFTFRLLSPFGTTDEPTTLAPAAARLAFAPVIIAEIGFDNRQGTHAVELLFGIGNSPTPFRPLEDATRNLVGFALGQGLGWAARPADVTARVQALSLFDPAPAKDGRGLHLLGVEAGLVFRVPAGESKSFPIALGFYQPGIITTGLPARYYYTRLFENLEAVLLHGLENHAAYRTQADERDRELASATHLNDDQRWLIAQATHSYLGSTQLLWDEAAGRPLWVVNEGEYRMINTFDLTVDHLFFELRWHPWAVRNTLDLFATRYAYTDELKLPDGQRGQGGVSFTHDMGVADQFTPPGTSSYECTGLTGCFSQMTAEQLLNWICCACTYAAKTGDHAWLREHQSLLVACAESLRNRDDPEPTRRTGLIKWDGSRCGPEGAEITTYDSLDVSLGQARNNLYIAVKAFAAWTLLEKTFASPAISLESEARAARTAADLSADAISKHFDPEAGMFPAVFEGGNRSRILPAVEGLVFPLRLGFVEELRTRYPALFANLQAHMTRALSSGVCLDEHTGAWKISSTSHNTWFSKIALAQHVVRQVFPSALNPQASAADQVHARMQQSPPLGRHAMVDQVHSRSGEALGSRYYPRIVTACLWLEETGQP